MVRRSLITSDAKMSLDSINRFGLIEFDEYKERTLKISLQGIKTKIRVKGRSKLFADERALSRFLNCADYRLRIRKTFFSFWLTRVSVKFYKTQISISFPFESLSWIYPRKRYIHRMKRLAQFFGRMFYYGEGLDSFCDFAEDRDTIAFPVESGGFTVIDRDLIPLDFHSRGKIFRPSSLMKVSNMDVLSHERFHDRNYSEIRPGAFLTSRVFIRGRKRAMVVFAFKGASVIIRFSKSGIRVFNYPREPLLDSDFSSLVYLISYFKGRRKKFYRMAVIEFIAYFSFVDRFIDNELIRYFFDEKQHIDFEVNEFSKRFLNLLKDELEVEKFAEAKLGVEGYSDRVQQRIDSVRKGRKQIHLYETKVGEEI